MRYFKINPKDNVAVDLSTGHKVALADIKPGEPVIKYGYPIGSATGPITQGDHVHVHNLKTNLSGIVEYIYNPVQGSKASESSKPSKPPKERTFMGYRRPDGQVGIRNEVWVINTVGCINKLAENIVQRANKILAEEMMSEGMVSEAMVSEEMVFTFAHPYGCSQLGDDHAFTQTILKNLINHPNAAGVLVLGLGCENNNIEEFKKALHSWDDNRVKFLNAQDASDEVEEALALIRELVTYAQGFKKQEIPVSELIIGLKCGGSDGLSGITANPLVGKLSDEIIAHGGTCLLTEVPEMFGAETLLMDRCIDEDVFNKAVLLINDFKEYFIRHGQEIYENPSPGNIEGGISTLEEKSLGCTQKGGVQGKVTNVLAYGDRVDRVKVGEVGEVGEVGKTPGLNLLQGPGNDLVATTNLAAAGAHIVLFTTGRGTPFGGVVPTVKVSSNTALAKAKPHWIDFDAGALLEEPQEEVAERFLEYCLAVASGEKVKNELNGYREISIFKDGVIL